MAFKVSNETKVGAFTAIAITLLILGFNFLKGNNPLKKSQYFYAKFEAIEGLVAANPVMMNGLVVGTVYKTEPADEFLTSILVTIRLTEPIVIPTDSKATIKGNLLSTPVIEITKGVATTYLKKGDTIQTLSSSGFLGTVLEQLGPTQTKLNSALGNMDSLLLSANKVLDANTQANLRLSMAHLSTITSNLVKTTQELNKLLSSNQNTLKVTLDNLQTTSKQMQTGTENLPAITANMEKVTKELSEAEFGKMVKNLDATISELQTTIQKVNDKDGTVGALLNDRKMYDNLTSAVNSLNLLMQDLRLNPKRYVNISVFGKKDKSTPLMKPMAEDSITQEQFRQQ